MYRTQVVCLEADALYAFERFGLEVGIASRPIRMYRTVSD